MATSNQRDPRTPNDTAVGSPHALSMPRTWFLAWTVLLVVPWLAVGAIYTGRPGEAAPPSLPPASVGPSVQAGHGPWGRLILTPIVVSPPLEYIGNDWGRGQPPEWHFPEATPELVESFLASTGMSSGDVSLLRSRSRPHAPTQGVIISPDVGFVRQMSPDVRGRLYSTLAGTQHNYDQANSFRFRGETPADWLGSSLISPATRRLVEPFIYRDGTFLHFADIEAIRGQVTDRDEMRRLAKTLVRSATVLVRLAVDSAGEVDTLADYWGRGGRRTDIRPLLESVANAGPDHLIDITHLLPTFARVHLYRYPKFSTADLDKPLLANCLWTSLNFFAATPNDRFLEIDVALETLRKNYYVIEHGFQLGDIVAFLDQQGNMFHIAVYLAEDLVFTKNGTSPMSPWTIMKVDEVKEYYKRRSPEPRLIYHRRNDF